MCFHGGNLGIPLRAPYAPTARSWRLVHVTRSCPTQAGGSQLVSVVTRDAIPTAFPNRESAKIGGLERQNKHFGSVASVWRPCGPHPQGLRNPADLPDRV